MQSSQDKLMLLICFSEGL